jgi:hypothetical protein
MGSVKSATVLPNFTLEAGEGADAAHLDHRLGKLVEEQALILSIFLDQFHGRPNTSCKKHFIRGKKPFSPQKELEIGVVKSCRGGEVQWRDVVVSTGPGTN